MKFPHPPALSPAADATRGAPAGDDVPGPYPPAEPDPELLTIDAAVGALPEWQRRLLWWRVGPERACADACAERMGMSKDWVGDRWRETLTTLYYQLWRV